MRAGLALLPARARPSFAYGEVLSARADMPLGFLCLLVSNCDCSVVRYGKKLTHQRRNFLRLHSAGEENLAERASRIRPRGQAGTAFPIQKRETRIV